MPTINDHERGSFTDGKLTPTDTKSPRDFQSNIFRSRGYFNGPRILNSFGYFFGFGVTYGGGTFSNRNTGNYELAYLQSNLNLTTMHGEAVPFKTDNTFFGEQDPPDEINHYWFRSGTDAKTQLPDLIVPGKYSFGFSGDKNSNTDLDAVRIYAKANGGRILIAQMSVGGVWSSPFQTTLNHGLFDSRTQFGANYWSIDYEMDNMGGDFSQMVWQVEDTDPDPPDQFGLPGYDIFPWGYNVDFSLPLPEPFTPLVGIITEPNPNPGFSGAIGGDLVPD